MYSHNGVLPHFYFSPKPAQHESYLDKIIDTLPDTLKILLTAIGWNRPGLMSAFLLSIAALMEYSARGKSDLFPSLARRGHKHVKAGAKMTRIHRLAKLYKTDLQKLPPGNYTFSYILNQP